MKKNNISWLIILVMLTIIGFASCKKDLGNYDYQDINEGTITNIEKSYSLLRGQVLSIKPDIQFTKDNSNDPNKYTYKWFIINPNVAPRKEEVIATTPDLNWTVNLPSISSDYPFYYEVIDKSTGVKFSKSFKLKVTTNIADGWLVLNDIDGEARLDFFNYNSTDDKFQYYKDILSTHSTLKLVGKPKMVYYMYRRDVFSGVYAKSIYVGTDQGTSVINTQDNTFSKYANVLSLMTSYYPAPFHVEKVRAAGSVVAYMFDSEGIMNFEDPSAGYAFGQRLNKLSSGETLNISKFFAEGYTLLPNYMLMFDVDGKRFIEHKSGNQSSSVPVAPKLPVTPENPAGLPMFDPGNMGMNLIFMDSTPAISGQTYAIFKNSANKVFLARISCNATAFTPLAYGEVTTAPEMANASSFAIDPQEGYIMYLVGSKVYRFNPFDKTNKMVVDLGTRTVSLIKYQKTAYSHSIARYIEQSRKLIICSYDSANPNTSGKIEMYTVPNLNGDLTLYKTFDGLGKIVDLSYRE